MLPFRPASGRVHGRARVLAAAFLVALLGALLPALPASPAQAAARTVAGGRLDWGIKSSFQSYVTGPIAHGSWSLTGGAATVGDSRFRFHSATGSYDPDSGALTAGFSGGVHFTGHRKPDGSYELDLTISRPQVAVADGRGTLFADMTSKEKGTGRVTTAARVPLATLGLGGLDTRGGATPIALTNVPAKLTAQGARAFAGYYTEGTQLDPVSLSADVRAGATGAGPGPTPSPSEGGDDGTTDNADSTDAPRGTFTNAAVDWGVRRTFREYVTGGIAKGAWHLTDGAQDGGALFRFPRGKGTYDAEKGTLNADFAGTLRFTGKDLDLTLTAVSVEVKDGRGTLAADVTSGGTRTGHTPLATFDAKRLAPEKGLITLTEVPAKLTADGAKAFGGMYSAGTDMDPVSLAVAVDKKAALPALPDLGTDPKAAAGDGKRADRAPAAAPAADSSPVSARTVILLVAAGVLLVAVAAFLVLRARRRTASTAPPRD
ncbi:Htaa domain protein [Streptomyces albofaciens JCM 4342]|uniref:HtaA domain-containing protein n=1 Tax=Streptomyces albofaciens TaxID=66866 RepID=UPI00123BE25A|nr:HtaA domain-containing protein [Streptomyces albofaciens]KAA6222240.1 Htaa domain protein [Streptomyces albofaciens JCM 4342]